MMSVTLLRTLALFVLVIGALSLPNKREEQYDGVADGIAEAIGVEEQYDGVADGIAEAIGVEVVEPEIPAEKPDEIPAETPAEDQFDGVADGIAEEVGEEEEFDGVADGIAEEIGEVMDKEKREEQYDGVADGIAEAIGEEEQYEGVADGIAEAVGEEVIEEVKPAKTPAETPAEIPAETPAEDQFDGVADGIAEEIGEEVIDEVKPAEIPAETPAEEQFDGVADGIAEEIGEEEQFDGVADGIAEEIGTIGEEPQSRKKRLADPNKVWPKAVVPVYTPKDYPADLVLAKDRAINVFSRLSCLRFPEWSNVNGVTTNQKLGLGHEGYVKFLKGDTCYATFGFTGGAQENSCCGGAICIHELGHTVGAFHENQNPLGSKEMRLNMGNVQDAYKPSYELKNGMFATGYDASSIMHYSRMTFTVNNRRTMNKLNSQWQRLGGDNYYYLVQETSLTHKCAETSCINYTTNCVNDGYMTRVDGKCECMCPSGLDPADGCRSVLGKADGPKWYETRPWPAGSYALPAVSSEKNCPSGFPNFQQTDLNYGVQPDLCKDIGSHCGYWAGTVDYSCTSANFKGYMRDNCAKTCKDCGHSGAWMSKNYGLFGSVENDYRSSGFCVADGTAGKPTNLDYGQEEVVWPAGQYCLYRVGDSCPAGFKEGSIFFDNSNNYDAGPINDDLGVKMPYDRIEKDTRIHYCCREDGYIRDDLNLPPTEQFALISTGAGCHNVRGMSTLMGWSTVRIPEAKATQFLQGAHPARPYTKATETYRINHCLYTPSNMECGGTIELSPENAERIITAPGKENSQCHWFFKGPEHTRIVIDFPEFDVADSEGHCVDKVAIRFNRLGQLPYDYCGKSFNRVITSFHNTLMVSFIGGKSSTFKGKVTLMHDGNAGYKMSLRGQDYRGGRDYTSGQRKCRPWKKMKHCPYTPKTHPKDGLTGNKCRNPGGDGTGPWCYFSPKECKRDYCDPGNFERAWDTKPGCKKSDCGKNKRKDRNFCAKTCGYHQ